MVVERCGDADQEQDEHGGQVEVEGRWPGQAAQPGPVSPGITRSPSPPLLGIQLETMEHEVFTITDRAPTRAFPWLKDTKWAPIHGNMVSRHEIGTPAQRS